MYEPGTVIAQKYWVERVLGEGGMGVVLAATHLQLGQRVALKFLRPAPSPDAGAVERFLREARAAVRLRSEHVCRVVDVGTVDAGTPYIVMEHLEGHDLASVLKKGGALPLAVAVDYVAQACLALAEAHVAGMVHRDLKPSNLFLTRRPEGTPLIKVMDFGIAKAHGRMDARLTDSSAIMGSPAYMSPEQLRSAKDVDARADIWSLGVCLFELVTRARPFDADTLAEIAAKVTLDPPAPLPSTLPRAFSDIVMRCLSKRAERRFSDVGELARALAPFGSPAAATFAAATTNLLAAAAAATSPRTDPLARIMAAETRPRGKSLLARVATSHRRTRVFAAVASLLVLALSAALIYVVTRSHSPAVFAPLDAPLLLDAPPPIEVIALPPDAAPIDAASPPADAAPASSSHSDPRPRRPDASIPPTRPDPDPASAPNTGPGDGSDLDLDGDGIPDIRGR
jgi:eukaryotic-like serine/threonine-protein kinase